jgi:hypothetical protein
MDYYVIRGPVGSGNSFGYAVKKQLDSMPVITPSHHEIFDATLFTNHQDAENALGELPHKVAKQCTIQGVTVRDLASAA